MKRSKITVTFRQDLPPHHLDAEIRRTFLKLRALVYQRAADTLGAQRKGKRPTPETVAKRADAHRGKKHPTAGAKIAAKLRGRTLSPEAREKVAEGMRRYHATRKAAGIPMPRPTLTDDDRERVSLSHQKAWGRRKGLDAQDALEAQIFGGGK